MKNFIVVFASLVFLAAAFCLTGSSAGSAAASPPSAEEEMQKADAMLAFSNNASMYLDTGWYALPDILQEQMAVYFDAWLLLPRPQVGVTRTQARQALTPPPGLFSPEDEARMAEAVQRMDRLLDSMLADYRAMSRYVADTTIRDDGARGRSLAFSMRKDHKAFVAAREQWAAVVEPRALEAEELLLQGHPLRRQITGAWEIFRLLGRAVLLLQEAKPDRKALENLWQKLAVQLESLKKPPFQGSPALERQYRAFLAEAGRFEAALGRGVNEGFYSQVRQGLNNAQEESRRAYNGFVNAVNSSQ